MFLAVSLAILVLFIGRSTKLVILGDVGVDPSTDVQNCLVVLTRYTH
jgi:hypothetical protein